MYDINNGRNADIVNSCAALRDYCIFINMIREYKKAMSLEIAIQKAVDDCIDKNVLKSFLLKYKGDVINMVTTGFNLDLAVDVAKEEGEKCALLKTAKKMKEAGMSYDDIIKFTGLTVDEVHGA